MSPQPQNDSSQQLPPGPLPHNTNRRFLPRMRSPFSIQIVGEEQALHGIDLSFGGLMATGPESIRPGTPLNLQITLPGDQEPLAVHARVLELVHHRGAHAMRMCFEAPSVRIQSQIADWMGRLSRQSSPPEAAGPAPRARADR